jgi:hypothetical protein
LVAAALAQAVAAVCWQYNLADLLQQLLHSPTLVTRQLPQQRQQCRQQTLLQQTLWGLNNLRFTTASQM